MTQFAGFERFYFDSTAVSGTQTLTEITEYVKSANIPDSSKTFDASTFAPLGAQNAKRNRRGAKSMTASLVVFINDTTWKIAMQSIGRRDLAVTLTVTQGANASPTTNNPKITFEAVLLKVMINHETDKELTMTWDLKPSDVQSTVVPQYTRV